MTDEAGKVALLICAIASFAVLLGLHVAFVRMFVAPNPGRFSSQKSLVILVALLNIPVAATTLMIANITGASQSMVEAVSALMYVQLVFNALSYAYFHFFNLSETGRRIRILTMLLNDIRLTAAAVERDYSPTAMVRVRLSRLCQMGQIRQAADGRYVVRGGFLLVVAKVLRRLSSLLMGRNRVPQH